MGREEDRAEGREEERKEGSSDRSSARRPCPQVPQWHPGVAKGVFWPVFGTAPPATDNSEAGLCGEEGFYRHFGKGTLN